MGFFGIGTGEIIIILIIALIVVGPNKLPELAKLIGKGFYEFKKAADDFRESVNTEIKVAETREKLDQQQEHRSEAPLCLEKPAESENLGQDEKKKDLF